MMAAPIPGDRFIRTFSHYLDSNEVRLASANHSLPKIEENTNNRNGPADTTSSITTAVTSLFGGSNASNEVPSSSQSFKTSTTGTPASLYGIQVPYMSLLMAASPSTSALSNTPYMPPRCTLSLDIHHYYFLLVQFEHLGLDIGDPVLLGEIPEGGVVETETSVDDETKAPSIMSVGSIASTMSTLSLSTGWSLWQRRSTQQEQRPLHEDIMHIHKFFARVSALKLQMNLLIDPQNATTRSSQRAIAHYEKPLPQDGSIVLSLSPFHTLSFLELSGIHPRFVDGWPELRRNLVSLVVKGANVEDAADVIQRDVADSEKDVTWQRLKMLSLADNSLTTLDNEPLQQIQSITHLNLSSNLLIDVPAALSHLYNLQSLQLAHNMISFVNGINTVLGNIQELDLRGNRLTMLAGLDRLWALERLDLRDNRIEDSAEIGRLTSLPNLEDVWIQGNPFTMLQNDYRVDIFTLFKQAGVDIMLDGTRPSFAERRRVSAATTSDDYRAPAASVAPPAWPTAQPGAASGGESDSTKTEQPKIARAKTKKSKRIVKLGQSEQEPPPLPTEEDDAGRKVHRVAELEEGQLARRASTSSSSRKRRSRSKARRSRSPSDDNKKEHRSVSPTTMSFRRKIESMRREAGTEWLRVLQEMDLGKAKSNNTSTAATDSS